MGGILKVPEIGGFHAGSDQIGRGIVLKPVKEIDPVLQTKLFRGKVLVPIDQSYRIHRFTYPVVYRGTSDRIPGGNMGNFLSRGRMVRSTGYNTDAQSGEKQRKQKHAFHRSPPVQKEGQEHGPALTWHRAPHESFLLFLFHAFVPLCPFLLENPVQ
jgi:hypothetical protein